MRPAPATDLCRARHAGGVEIARACWRLAPALHPGAAPHDGGTAARFRAVADARQVLSDSGRRAAYDRPARPAAASRPAHVSGSASLSRVMSPPEALPPGDMSALSGEIRALWAAPAQVARSARAALPSCPAAVARLVCLCLEGYRCPPR